MTQEEIDEMVSQLNDTITPTAQKIANCQRHVMQYWASDQIPVRFLAQQWVAFVTLMANISEQRDGVVACLNGLRSIAVCMHATAFPEAHMYLDVTDMLENNLKLSDTIVAAQEALNHNGALQ